MVCSCLFMFMFFVLGFLYAMEFLEHNLEWLKKRLDLFSKDYYVLFDCPGQVELYSHHDSMKNIVKELQSWNYRVK